MLSAASLLLMPGLVGLAVVDAFAYQCPLVTTDQPFHSPEIEYLHDGKNGIVLPRTTTPDEYATAAAALLGNPAKMATLRAGCRQSAEELSMAAMVENFATGVLAALEAT